MKTCTCGRELSGRQRTRCSYCAKADPHRHAERARKLPQMFVSVDSETKWSEEDGRQCITTLSFGREDGTSASWHGSEPTHAYRWLLDHLCATYTSPDGTTYRQVAVAFHFSHDTAVLANNLRYEDMFLVRKVQSKIRTALCGRTHPEGERCDTQRGETGLLHRYDVEDCKAVLTDGIHSDLAAFDPESGLALAFANGQGAYIEDRPEGDRYESWRRLRIRDTGRAFTGGLERVIEHWSPDLSTGQRAAIAWGKQARLTGFEGATDQQIADYSEAECIAHARVCRKLLECIAKAAFVPMKPDQLGGSGTIAAAVMKHYGVSKRVQTHVEATVDDLATLTYFGGCIETPVVGLVAGLVDEEDINSAYPSQMVHLPCMRAGHGVWTTARYGSLPESDVEVGHALVSWAIRRGETSTPPFIVRRTDGRVAQPLMGERIWVTLAELRTAVERYRDQIFIHRVVFWRANCPCEAPFGFLADLYNARNRYKAEMATCERYSARWHELDDLQRTIKLLINSIYGKLAQTRPEPGPFTNLHYASYITGATRAQMRRKTWEREDEGATVVYQHTDSVLSTGGNPVDGGSALGAWGLEKPTRNFLVVQPGLAMALGNDGKTATRGCGVRAFTLAAWNWYNQTTFENHPASWPKLVTEQQVMISLRLAMARGKPHLAGSFETKVTETRVASPKRDFRRAEPVPGNPTAWMVPPITRVEDPITEPSQMRAYKSALDRRRKAGEFDK